MCGCDELLKKRLYFSVWKKNWIIKNKNKKVNSGDVWVKGGTIALVG